MMPASLASRACHTSGALCISAFVRSWFLRGPPSIMYEASVNGAPAKPISGVSPNAEVSSPIVSATAATCSSCRSGRASTSALVRTGLATTGPVPGTMSTPTPAAYSGTTMSLYRMAASTPCRRTGWSVISQARSGVRQESSIAMPARARWYSGSDRPACRMNQTGVRDGSPPRAATSRGASERSRRTETGAVFVMAFPSCHAAINVGHGVVSGARDPSCRTGLAGSCP